MSENQQDWARAMASAHREGTAKPNLDQDLTLAQAYEIQVAMVNELGSSICGFKGALSAKPAQEMFGVGGPLVGVLLADAEVETGFGLSQMVNPMLEVELGFVLAKDVVQPIETDSIDVKDLHQWFSECCVAIELAEVAYSARPSAQDLVAGNSAAGRFIRGPALETRKVDDIAIELKSGDEVLNAGVSGEIGHQALLAVALINSALEAGYAVQKGALIMTGSIGKIIPAKPGQYVASYSFGQDSQELESEGSQGATVTTFEWTLGA